LQRRLSHQSDDYYKPQDTRLPVKSIGANGNVVVSFASTMLKLSKSLQTAGASPLRGV
jgi:hypothetical protein